MLQKCVPGLLLTLEKTRKRIPRRNSVNLTPLWRVLRGETHASKVVLWMLKTQLDVGKESTWNLSSNKSFNWRVWKRVPVHPRGPGLLTRGHHAASFTITVFATSHIQRDLDWGSIELLIALERLCIQREPRPTFAGNGMRLIACPKRIEMKSRRISRWGVGGEIGKKRDSKL